MLKRVLLALVLVAATLSWSAATTVAAEPPTCEPPAVPSFDSSSGQYSCTVPGGGGGPGTTDPGDPGGGGGAPAEPTCELFGEYNDYCIGVRPCYDTEWRVPMAMPKGPKPHPDSEPRARWCWPGGPDVFGPPGMEIYWSGGPDEPQPPSLLEQSQTAIGQLDLDLPPLRTSPEGRTLVRLPTWFWLDGAEPEQTGSSAFGLVAIAVVRELRVDPGDGSPSFSCPWTTSAQQAETSCSHVYERASQEGAATWQGKPAHTASVSAVWELRFEVNGTPVTIPGAPTTLDGPTSTAVLRVDEVQSVVTG